jgi:hypothetical protein
MITTGLYSLPGTYFGWTHTRSKSDQQSAKGLLKMFKNAIFHVMLTNVSDELAIALN